MPPKKKSGSSTNESSQSTKSTDLSAKEKCSLCCQFIIPGKDEALFCSGSCQGWLHRYCAAVTIQRYKHIKDNDAPFLCFCCSETNHSREVATLKNTIDQLKQEVAQLNESLRATREQVQLQVTSVSTLEETLSPLKQEVVHLKENLDGTRVHAPLQVESQSDQQSYATAARNSKPGPSSSQPAAGMMSNPRSNLDSERKFNIIVYGITECPKGTPKHTRLQSDLSSVVSVMAKIDNNIQPQSIKDCFRLGKFLPDRESPRPILVKLIRISDVSSVLSKRGNLHYPLCIKPDLTLEERLCESVLMKERWRLIQSGIARGDIRVRGSVLYVRRKVYGRFMDSKFQHVSAQSSHNGTQPLTVSDNTTLSPSTNESTAIVSSDSTMGTELPVNSTPPTSITLSSIPPNSSHSLSLPQSPLPPSNPPTTASD